MSVFDNLLQETDELIDNTTQLHNDVREALKYVNYIKDLAEEITGDDDRSNFSPEENIKAIKDQVNNLKKDGNEPELRNFASKFLKDDMKDKKPSEISKALNEYFNDVAKQMREKILRLSNENKNLAEDVAKIYQKDEQILKLTKLLNEEIEKLKKLRRENDQEEES